MRSAWMLVPAAIVAAPCQAEVYFTLGQVQQALFPGERLAERPLRLTREQVRAIEQAGGVRVREPAVQAWQASGGGWLFVDRVLGKHEFITYALALDAAGAVHAVEIMEYRESYGGEVRSPAWRAQFRGKTRGAPLKLDADIQNISGATLSSVHVTEGVRRLLATHAVALAGS